MIKPSTSILPASSQFQGGGRLEDDLSELEIGNEDRKHAIEAATAMADMDRHKVDVKRSKAVASRLKDFGHGGALLKKVKEYAGIRDDVKASKAPKRKRQDAGDIRTDRVQSYVYEYTQPSGQPGLMQLFTPHKPNFVLERSQPFGHKPSVLPSLSEYKKKKRKHEGGDPGFRGYGRGKLTIDDIRKELVRQGLKGGGGLRDQVVDQNTTDYYSNYFLDI